MNDWEKLIALILAAAFIGLLLYVVGWILETTCLDVPKHLC